MTTRLDELKSNMTNHGRAVFPAKDQIKVFQVLGERASGTNFIQKIIGKNLNIKHTQALGWKHGFPHMAAVPSDCLVVCAVRNPHDWVLSMHKRPWHAAPTIQHLDFHDFIRTPWASIIDKTSRFPLHGSTETCKGQTLQHDRHPITGKAFETVFHLRNAKLQALQGLLNRNCAVAFIQIEHAAQNPDDMLDWLAGALSLSRTQDALKLPSRRLGNKFKRDVDAHPITPQEMSDTDNAFMLSELDHGTEAVFGYAPTRA